jgi:hypothetical protein
MSSNEEGNNGTSRRAFFQDVTAGTAGLALATALTQLAAPAMAVAQEAKTPPPPSPNGTDGSI